MGGVSSTIRKIGRQLDSEVIRPVATLHTKVHSTVLDPIGVSRNITDPFGLLNKKPSAPQVVENPTASVGDTTVGMEDSPLGLKQMRGLGSVSEGASTTFKEEEEKRKSLKKKKLGTRSLQIPLQTTTAAQGVSGEVSSTGGLQL